jgi:predicted Zn-dependent protease
MTGMGARKAAAVLVAGAMLLGACAVNPVTGKRELSLISESQEIRMGQEGAQSVVNTVGLYPDSSLQAYVNRLGQSMALASERPQLPWSFAVVNDATVNAFALPGGSIFVTRGILTYFNSEAELMSVLGHEIGHVTAKHSVSQISKAQIAQLGLGVGMVLTPNLDVVHQVAGSGLQVLFLKFGRDDEAQSDDLGFRYMVEAGYDPREATDMFEMLGRLSGGGRLPEWQSTHPDPENRAAKSAERAATMTVDPSTLRVGRDDYLRQIEGVVFGANPREGYFDDTRFHHPDLKFRVSFPPGWNLHNLSQAVIGLNSAEDAVLQLRIVQAASPRVAADTFVAQAGVRQESLSSLPINGLSADTRYFSISTQRGVINGLVAHVAYDGNIYQLLGYGGLAAFSRERTALSAAIDSFEPETDATVLAVEPARIDLVRLPRRMTVTEFHRRYPSSIPVEQVAMINGVEVGDTLARGLLVKRVTGGP